jgi:hypothetical protein
MTRFVHSEDRRQGVLLPQYLDDYVAEDNVVRVIDAGGGAGAWFSGSRRNIL